MYIKQVVLDGFKSYAQRTEIQGFDPEFNAITGLNGSGKSNILDAICFLLGISNLSQVRAGSLQELVYKGGQAGVTKATVTITFDNRDKQQSPLGYETYDELTVSRQVVIGGRNKYLINGSNATPSRVQDLFRSVQLNVNNPHFLIMQGRITKVLNMKPVEILSMIEEAAGTRMYESKRSSAQKTIEKKDTKLREIEVILDEEISPTLRKLKEERSSYLEYQKVMREVEHLTRLNIAFQFVQAEESRNQSSTELEEMKRGVEELRSKMAEANEAIVEISSAIADLERKRGLDVQGPVVELEGKVDEAAKTCAVAEATLKHSKDVLATERKNEKALTKSYNEDKALLESKRSEVASRHDNHKELQERSRSAEKAVQAAQQHFQAVTAGLSSGADGQEETLAAQKIACENEISNAVTEIKQAEMRLKNGQTELKEKERDSRESEHSYSKDKTTWDGVQRDVNKIQAALDKLDYQEGLEEELTSRREQLHGEVARLQEKAHTLESKFPQVQFDYSPPTPGFDRARVKGPVARLIKVKDISTATALEVTAGNKLFNVVVDTEETGKQLLQKGKLRRRYTIIPLNKIAARSLNNDTVKKAQALVGRDKARPALSLVGYEEELRPAMAYVFGSTFVCDTLQDAKKVTFDKGVSSRSVALSGDVFDPSGTLTGGSRAQGPSILSKLEELASCEAELQARRSELTVLSNQLTDLRKLAHKYAELRERLEGCRHEGEMVRARMEQSSHHQQLTQLQQLSDSMVQLKDVLKQAQSTEKTAKTQLKDIQQKMKDSKSHHERELRAAEEGVSRAKREAEEVGTEARGREMEMQALQLEVGELEKAVEGQQQQLEAAAASIAGKIQAVEEHTETSQSAKEALKAAKVELDALKAALREQNKELQKREAERKALEKEKVEGALRVKEVEHKIAKFHKDSREATQRVEAMLAKYEWIASDRQYFGRANTAYDFAANDPREVARRLGKLQEQQGKLGKSVNMRAMNMLGKAEEKYNDLLKKKGIVEKDKAKISELITELDQKKNEALKSAYERVNQDFSSIFTTLLPGACAKLAPLEGRSVLEGVEVRIGFGGVWKESLQELSGGQRSLVALSLILSLLLFKPAPVYILDEVDAALDLSHTQNIGQMLRTHFKHSQFIVVSLKDGMFNNANVLYKTKFVDGVSTVTRYVNPRAGSSIPPSVRREDGTAPRGRGRKAAASTTTASGLHTAKKARTTHAQ